MNSSCLGFIAYSPPYPFSLFPLLLVLFSPGVVCVVPLGNGIATDALFLNIQDSQTYLKNSQFLIWLDRSEPASSFMAALLCSSRCGSSSAPLSYSMTLQAVLGKTYQPGLLCVSQKCRCQVCLRRSPPYRRTSQTGENSHHCTRPLPSSDHT